MTSGSPDRPSSATAAKPDPALLRQAAGLMRAGRFAEAASLLEAAARDIAEPGPLLLEAGRLFLRAGDKDAARRCLEGSVAADRTLAAAHMNLGLLLAERGEPRAAWAALDAARALRPEDPEIALNLAVVEINIEPPRAIQRLRDLLLRHPAHRLALLNLAQACIRSGLHDEALACLERLLAIEPENATWQLLEAGTLLNDGRLERARAAYEAILARDPSRWQALVGLAQIDRFAGDNAGEAACWRRVLAIDPNHAVALAGLARLETPTPTERRHIERLAMAPERPPAERYPLLHALFDLSDRDRAADPVVAFSYLATANRLRGESERAVGRVYDAAAEEARIERLMRRFDAGWFERLAQRPAALGDPSERPVFIVGMPRSGTTLCEQILASHSRAQGLGERVDIARIARELGLDADQEGAVAPDPASFRGKAQDYLRMLDRQAPGVSRVVDKTPGNFLHLGTIATLFPNARIVHAQRGAMDVCFSCFRQNFVQSHRWSTDLRDLGHYYGLYRRLMAHWQSLLPRPMLDWRYEAVVGDLEPAVRRLLGFCDLAFEPACLAFHETRRPVRTASLDQVRRPLYKSSVGKWRRYEAMLVPLAQSLAAAGIAEP